MTYISALQVSQADYHKNCNYFLTIKFNYMSKSLKFLTTLLILFFIHAQLFSQAYIGEINHGPESIPIIPGCSKYKISVEICNVDAYYDPTVNFYVAATGFNPLVSGSPVISDGNYTFFGLDDLHAIGTLNVEYIDNQICTVIDILYTIDPLATLVTPQEFVFSAWNDSNSNCSTVQLPTCPSSDPNCVECSGPLCNEVCGPLEAINPAINASTTYYSNINDNTVSEIFANQVNTGTGNNQIPNECIQTATSDVYSYVIEEDLLVDTDWCEILNPGSAFSKGISINPGKKIIIPDGVSARFEYYSFDSCSDVLWDAIEVMPGGSLTLINCKISNGYNAIRAHEGANLNLTRCNFTDNYVSLSLEGDTNANSPANPFNITFINNVFSGSGNLIHPFPGLSLVSNELPYAGIELTGVSFADLAAPNPTSIATTNFFDNMHNGIVSRASSFILKEAHFSNMFEMPNPDGNIISGYGIYANNGRSRAYNFFRLLDSSTESLFSNMPVGISMQNNMNSFIDKPTMSSVERGIEVLNCVSTNHIIKNSEIDATEFGIRSSNNTPLFGIMQNNNISINSTSYNPTSTVVSGGIVCTENVTRFAGWNITGNEILLQKGDVGVHYSNGGGAKIADNRILKAAGQKNLSFTLAQVINSPNTEIDCNELTNLDSSGNFSESIGLDVIDSPMMTISCNDISFVEEGVHFDGPSEGTDFKANSMTNGFVGLQLTSSALISPQSHKGNCFDDNQNAEAVHNSTLKAFIEMSLFTVKCGQDQTSNSCICPSLNDIFTGTNNPSDFFKQEPFGDTDKCQNQNETCAEFSGRPIAEVMANNTSQNIAAGNASYPANQSNYERMMQHNLFAALESANIELNSTDYQVFYDDALQSDLSVVALATKTIDRTANQYTLIENLEDKLSQLTDLKQSYDNGQISESTYEQNKANLIASLNTDISSINAEEQTYQNNLSDEINDYQALVANMQGLNAYDVNMKWALEKMLEFKHPDFTNFDANTWNSIYNLGIQCSVDAGHAVYVARSLYNTKEWVDFEELQNCNSFQARKLEDTEITPAEFDLFPNPTFGNFTINWTGEDSARLTLIDAQGKNTQTQIINYGQNTILTQNIAPGIYFYTILDANGQNNQGKLIILDK